MYIHQTLGHSIIKAIRGCILLTLPLKIGTPKHTRSVNYVEICEREIQVTTSILYGIKALVSPFDHKKMSLPIEDFVNKNFSYHGLSRTLQIA